MQAIISDGRRAMPLTYRYKGEGKENIESPDRKDPDFLRKKEDFIAGRQFPFHRTNTALGAPSDFTWKAATAPSGSIS